MDQEVLDAREKLKARFGQSQIGGKGTSFSYFLLLSARSFNNHLSLKRLG